MKYRLKLVKIQGCFNPNEECSVSFFVQDTPDDDGKLIQACSEESDADAVTDLLNLDDIMTFLRFLGPASCGGLGTKKVNGIVLSGPSDEIIRFNEPLVF